jgi:hypothetical protein
MTGYLVVPTLTALTAENQPFEQFWAASCESWAKAPKAQELLKFQKMLPTGIVAE